MNINDIINETLTEFFNETLNIEEDYPTSFDIDYFKTLQSFNKRALYCEQHLQRISSGSARIVYKIDNEKVLKLAKNKKGLAQNEVEIEYGGDYYLQDVLAKVIDHNENNLWVEMELARKLTKPLFKSIVGVDFDTFADFIRSYYYETNPSKGRHMRSQDFDEETKEYMWENEFTSGILDFIGSYGVPVNDLARMNSYGVVKRDGQDTVVVIDFGLTDDVYDSYYK